MVKSSNANVQRTEYMLRKSVFRWCIDFRSLNSSLYFKVGSFYQSQTTVRRYHFSAQTNLDWARGIIDIFVSNIPPKNARTFSYFYAVVTVPWSCFWISFIFVPAILGTQIPTMIFFYHRRKPLRTLGVLTIYLVKCTILYFKNFTFSYYLVINTTIS